MRRWASAVRRCCGSRRRAVPARHRIRPDHHVRRVNTKGYVVWRDQPLYLSEALRGETVALAPRDDGDWAIRFRGFDLAVLGERANQLRRSGLARTVRPASGEPGVAAART